MAPLNNETKATPPPWLHPEAAKLFTFMTAPPVSHPRFGGAPIDWTQIDALALGDLWTIAREVRHRERPLREQSLAAALACRVFHHGEPVFRGAACRDYLELLAREEETERSPDHVAHFAWHQARFALERCIDLTPNELDAAAQRFLAAANWREGPHVAAALIRLTGEPFASGAFEKLARDLAGSPLEWAEIQTLCRLDLSAHLLGAKTAYPSWPAAAPDAPACHPLSRDPLYAAFVEAGLAQAVAHLRQIHGGERPYASDKAFSLADSAVIARLMRVGLDHDAAWVPAMLQELLLKASLAPTPAKTCPSQSVAIALGHAIEALPTPEAVEILRHAVGDIRHGGVKKKLQRNLNGAGRGLATRPEIALRLPPGESISRARLAILAQCLEASLVSGMMLGYDRWSALLAGHVQIRDLMCALVWTVTGADGAGASILPRFEQGQLVLRNAGGGAVAPDPNGRVMLWHPTDASPEARTAWRDRIAALRIKQPFKQVFREHYSLPDEDGQKTRTDFFAGHMVSIVPLLGLARKERWRICDDCLVRSFGQWTARFVLADRVYPGCTGGTVTKDLTISASSREDAPPVLLRDLPHAALSEILRAVDLLVSVSGFALTTTDVAAPREERLQRLAQGPLGAMADMRKQALACSLKGLGGMEDLHFDARHLRLGPYAIHLATGHVTCDGEPLSIDPPKSMKIAGGPWLPFDERLLETILHAALEIAARWQAGTGKS